MRHCPGLCDVDGRQGVRAGTCQGDTVLSWSV